MQFLVLGEGFKGAGGGGGLLSTWKVVEGKGAEVNIGYQDDKNTILLFLIPTRRPSFTVITV